MSYRGDHIPEPVSEFVTVSRTEYAVLRRAKDVLDAVNTGLPVYIDGPMSSGRRKWEVWIETLEGGNEGKGHSLQEAIENAMDLEPVEEWYPSTQPARWIRWMLAGAGLSGLVQWML
jgi:hypothetical protein